MFFLAELYTLILKKYEFYILINNCNIICVTASKFELFYRLKLLLDTPFIFASIKILGIVKKKGEKDNV